jgi:pantothenate kinase
MILWEERVKIMDYKNANKLLDFLSEKIRFIEVENINYKPLSKAYKLLVDFDDIRVYNLEKRLKNGLKFKNTLHILDVLENTPNWL